MATGYERREETQPLAAPQMRVQQVRGPGVGMPGGAAPQVDTSLNLAIGELARFGSTAMGEFIERRQKENYLEGQAMYAQGKTLVEIEDAGGNFFHKSGWQTMEAQNAGAMWAVAQEQAIDDKDYETDPEEYRKSMSKSLVALTEGRDARSTAMIMETANKYLPGLASKQISKNAEYRKTKTMDTAMNSVAALSAADIDKPSFLAALDRSEGSTLGKLNDKDYNRVIVGGILKAYENDNPNAYAWAAEAGLTNQLDAASLATLRQAENSYKTRQESKYSEEYTMEKAADLAAISAGKMSLPEALKRAQDRETKYGRRFDQQDANQIAGQVLSEDERRRREAEAEAKAAQKQAEAESRAQQYALGFLAYSQQIAPYQDKLNAGEITASEFYEINTKMVQDMGLPITSGLVGSWVGDVAQAHQAQLIQQGKDAALDAANSTFDYSGLSTGQVQDAIDRKRTQIFQGAQDAIAEGRTDEQTAFKDANAKWQSYLEQSGQVDAKTKAVFNTFLNGSLLDSKGEVPVNVEKAFAQFMDMYNANPQLAMRHIQGDDAKARVQMMIDYYQEPGNYGGALASVALAESNARQYGVDPSKFLENPIVTSTINTKVDEYLSDNRLGLTDVIFGNTTWQQYFNQSNESIKRATEGAKQWLPTAIKNEATRLKARNPALDDQSAIETAKGNVSRETVYMGGAFVRTKGYNVYDKMFVNGAGKYSTNPAIPNDALYAYLDKYGNTLWKEDLFGPSLPDPELQIVPDPTGTGLLVQVRRPQSFLDKVVGRGHTWTSQMPVPFRSMGMEWESQYKAGLLKPRQYRDMLPQQGPTKQQLDDVQRRTNEAVDIVKETLGIQ